MKNVMRNCMLLIILLSAISMTSLNCGWTEGHVEGNRSADNAGTVVGETAGGQIVTIVDGGVGIPVDITSIDIDYSQPVSPASDPKITDGDDSPKCQAADEIGTSWFLPASTKVRVLPDSLFQYETQHTLCLDDMWADDGTEFEDDSITFTTEGSYWAEAFGGASLDYADQVLEVDSFIVVGRTLSFGLGNFDLLLYKLSTSGDIEWQKVIGDASSADVGRRIRQTSDGGYIVAGYTSSFGAGSRDVWVIKFDSNDEIEWEKAYGGGNLDQAASIVVTSDGGYIVVGSTTSFGFGVASNLWVIKLDSNGEIEFEKAFGGGAEELVMSSSIQEISGGGYIVAGRTNSYGAGDYDGWLLKLDIHGGIVWQKTYGGAAIDFFNSIQQTSDGGYIIAAATQSFGAGDQDGWILKLDSNGLVTWQKTYGGTEFENLESIEQTTDGGYIVAGATNSFGAGGREYWVLKLDSSGNIRWENAYGGDAALDTAHSVQQTSFGGYIVAGEGRSFGAGDFDNWILKLDADGNIGDTCSVINASSATVSDTAVTGVDSSSTEPSSSATITDTTATVVDISLDESTQCTAP